MKNEDDWDGFESDDRTDEEWQEALTFLRGELKSTIRRCGLESDLTFDDLAITLQELALEVMEISRQSARGIGDEDESED
jgi:hypothetical protein